jgi:CheY-like chemotaxis protein
MLQTKHVLLVEDDIHLVQLLLRAVPPMDPPVQIDHVADGVSALDFIQCQGKFLDRLPVHPRLVLVDLSMPKLGGLEFLRQIKQAENLRTIPVVMLTSSRNEKDILKCYQAGANAYVVKPIDYREFRTVIGQLLIFWMCTNEVPPAFGPAAAPRLNETSPGIP